MQGYTPTHDWWPFNSFQLFRANEINPVLIQFLLCSLSQVLVMLVLQTFREAPNFTEQHPIA